VGGENFVKRIALIIISGKIFPVQKSVKPEQRRGKMGFTKNLEGTGVKF